MVKKKQSNIIKIIIILIAIFLLSRCQAETESETEEPADTTEEETGCITNDDCNIQTEQCVNGICVPWNPLGQ